MERLDIPTPYEFKFYTFVLTTKVSCLTFAPRFTQVTAKYGTWCTPRTALTWMSWGLSSK